MKEKTPTSSASKSASRGSLSDAFDNYLSWMAFWLFLSAVNLAMEASAFLLSEELGNRVHAWAQYPSRGGLLIIVVAVIAFLRHRRRSGWKRVDRRAFLESYTMENLKRSGFVAFLVTLPTIVYLDILTNHTELPADFFIKLPGVALVGTFSLCFIFLNRNIDGEETC